MPDLSAHYLLLVAAWISQWRSTLYRSSDRVPATALQCALSRQRRIFRCRPFHVLHVRSRPLKGWWFRSLIDCFAAFETNIIMGLLLALKLSCTAAYQMPQISISKPALIARVFSRLYRHKTFYVSINNDVIKYFINIEPSISSHIGLSSSLPAR